MNIEQLQRRTLPYFGTLVAGSLLCAPAFAGNVTISAPQTTPVATSNADGAGPGDVNITADGAITVATGSAVTIDSSNAVTNAGAIKNTGDSGVAGISAFTTDTSGSARTLTGAITNNGTISIPGPATSTGPVRVYDGGIVVSGSGTFRGPITQNAGASIAVGGTGSAGIAVFSTLDGSLTNSGTISMSGQAAYGVYMTGPVSGSFVNTGSITAPTADSIGVYAGGNLTGAFINQGTISTGATSTTDSLGNTVQPITGSYGVWINANVGGILLDGNGVPKSQETIDTPATDSSISSQGSKEALYIGSAGGTLRDITVGALAGDPNGASLVIRGNVLGAANTTSIAAHGLTIAGTAANGTVYHTTLVGGLENLGGDIITASVSAPATSLTVGDYAVVPSLTNTGNIFTTANDAATATGAAPLAGNAYAVLITPQGRLPQLVNSGTIGAAEVGTSRAVEAIADASGTLLNVVNSGSISATVNDLSTGVALDLSHATSAVTIANSGSIAGDIVLANGANTLTSTAGSLSGNIRTGSGDDTVTLSNTTMTGTIDLGLGANVLNATNSALTGGITLNSGRMSLSGTTLTIPAGSVVSASSAQFSNGSAITFVVDTNTGTVGSIRASGPVNVAAGTAINTIIAGQVGTTFTTDLIEAQSLTMNADLTALQPPSTIMYSRQIKLADSNPNVLQLVITRNSASSLGLTANQGAVYDNVVPALATDDGMSAALGSITSRAEFGTALNQLLPDTTNATRQITVGAEDMARGAIRRRLTGMLRDADNGLDRYRDSFWAQEYTTYGTQSSSGDVAGYRLISQGLSAGIDGEIVKDWQVGLSFSQTLSYIDENTISDRSIGASTSGLDFYMRRTGSLGFIQAIAGGSYDNFRGSRHIDIGDVSREAGAHWAGNQLGGTVDAGTVLGSGAAQFTPYLRGSYERLYEQGYREVNGGDTTSGGDAIDLTYASRTNTSIRGGAGFIFDYRTNPLDTDTLGLNLRGDYAHEFRNAPYSVRAEFAGGSVFSVTGLPPGASVFTGGLGASLTSRNRSLSLDYDAQYTGKYLAHTLTFTYRQRL